MALVDPAQKEQLRRLYYEKNDHLQTRSESLFFTYKFAPGDEDALRRGVKFELSNLANEIVRTGESREFELRDGLAIYRLLPGALAGLTGPLWAEFISCALLAFYVMALVPALICRIQRRRA